MDLPTLSSSGDAVGKATRKHIRSVSDALDRATKQVKTPLTKIKERTTGSRVSPKTSEDEDEAAAPVDQDDNNDAADASPAVAQDAVVVSDTPVPPDEAIKKMDIFVNETLRNVTVQEYYDKVWSETNKEQQFYGPWLAKNNKTKIVVSDWEMGDSSRGYVGPLDGETYGQKRVITFLTQRSGIGPSTAEVTQTHLCRMEGSDRCVVSITINMKVPFGDSFSVSVRWVASRSGATDLSIQCGMQVVFNKSCM